MKQWRRFNFFDKEHVRAGEDKSPHLGIQALDISCTTSGRGRIVFGDADGGITLVDKEFRLHTFPAFKQRVTHVHHLPRADVLVCIGDGLDPRSAAAQEQSRAVAMEARVRAKQLIEAAGAEGTAVSEYLASIRPPEPPAPAEPPQATLKVWRLNRGGDPVCLRTVRVFPNKTDPQVITQMAVLSNLSQIAVGLEDGSVILFRGEFHRERGSVKSDVIIGPSPRPDDRRASRQPSLRPQQGFSGAGSGVGAGSRIAEPPPDLHVATRGAVTGLEFNARAHRGGQVVSLFVCTTDRVLSVYTAAPKAMLQQPVNVLNDVMGCAPGCAVSGTTNAGEFLFVGGDEAIFFYSAEDNKGCYVSGLAKRRLAWFRRYLLVSSIDDRSGRSSVSVYDLKNKFVAFTLLLSGPSHARASSADGAHDSSRQPRQVVDMVSEWGALFVLTDNHVLYKLSEKDTGTKLEYLFKIHLFDKAIDLAKSNNYDDANIRDIYRMYGDYLYKKNDFDKAIQQYTETIGHVEPSYVIRMFLDAHRIHNLTVYLEKLHEKQLASEDHTTLLLNCYTKLKEQDKLKAFIRGDVADATPAAPAVAAGAGSGSGAGSGEGGEARPAKKKLTFDVETAIRVLRQAGCLDEALYLAKQEKQHSWYLKIQVEDRRDYDAALKYIVYLPFTKAEANLEKYGKALVTHRPIKTTEVLKSLCTDYTPEGGVDEEFEAIRAAADSSARVVKPTSDPEKFIPLYVDHPIHLKNFLQYVVDKKAQSSTLVWNTLLELWLRDDLAVREAEEAGEGARSAEELEWDRAERRDHIKGQILDNPDANLDMAHALVLVQMHKFKAGQLLMYEKMSMYHMVIQHYMAEATALAAEGRVEEAREARMMIVDKCEQYGDYDPNLWVQVLTYFTKGYNGTEDDEEAIKSVLKAIDSARLLPPLLVVRILSTNDTLPLRVLREFIVQFLSGQESQIKGDSHEIKKLRSETEEMRTEVYNLKSRAEVFQAHRCNHCERELDLPAVHFLCKHSFHQQCLSDHDYDCPICMPDFQRVLQIQSDLGAKPGSNERFMEELDLNNKDGFSTVADYFGRGMFSATPAAAAAASAPAMAELDLGLGAGAGAGSSRRSSRRGF